MAGIAGPPSHEPAGSGAVWIPVSNGAFSPLAFAQYAALARMRWNAFRNGLRTTRGMLEAATSSANYLVYTAMGIGITIGMGAGAFMFASTGRWSLITLLLWGLFCIWQGMPIFIASFQQQFDLTGLLRFPIAFAPFFLLHILFGLVDIAAILGGLGSIGILAGIAFAKPGLLVWAAAGIVLFCAFNVLLSRAIFAWLDRWLGQRKIREIVSVLFLLAILFMQFLNPALRHPGQRSEQAVAQERARTERELAIAASVQRWLPPGLAVSAIEGASGSHAVPALGALGLLACYGLLAGLVLGVRLRAEHRGESLGEMPQTRKADKQSNAVARSSAAAHILSLGGAGPIGAIIEKDLRTVMRSLPLLYALGAPLLMVFVLASLMHGSRHAVRGFSPVLIPTCIAYALLGFTQLIYNNLGTEGAGIQLIFFSPTPMRTVMLAKNIFHAMLFSLIAIIAGVVACERLGAPDPAWLVATAAWLVFALPAHLAAGNLFSLAMPHRVNLGRIGRQRGGQATALLAMLVQLGILAVGGAVIGLSLYLDTIWLAAPVLLAFAVPAIMVWLRVLRNADAMARRRRDDLIAVLAKVD